MHILRHSTRENTMVGDSNSIRPMTSSVPCRKAKKVCPRFFSLHLNLNFCIYMHCPSDILCWRWIRQISKFMLLGAFLNWKYLSDKKLLCKNAFWVINSQKHCYLSRNYSDSVGLFWVMITMAYMKALLNICNIKISLI